MKVLSREKTKVLAEKNGWPLAMAEGYVDGETCRRRGKAPSAYARIGIDEYSLGFRAGYYERQDSLRHGMIPPATVSELPLARLPSHQSRESHEVSGYPQGRVISEQAG